MQFQVLILVASIVSLPAPPNSAADLSFQEKQRIVTEGIQKVRQNGLDLEHDPAVVAQQPIVQATNEQALKNNDIASFKPFDNLRHDPTGVAKIANAQNIAQLKGTGDENLEALANQKAFQTYFAKEKLGGDKRLQEVFTNSNDGKGTEAVQKHINDAKQVIQGMCIFNLDWSIIQMDWDRIYTMMLDVLSLMSSFTLPTF